MVVKNCRLCFEAKARLIGIFSAKGTKLKIADIISEHLHDKVDERDLLSKLICIDCWSKLADFHEFFNAIDGARSLYSKRRNSLKNKVPKFVEIDCDAYGFADVIASANAIDIGDVEMLPAERNCSAKCVENKTFEQRHKRIVIKQEIDYDVIETPDANQKQLDQFVWDYVNPWCEICSHRCDTLTEFKNHYRRMHNKRSTRMRCCNRMVLLFNILDHIDCHMNPDKYKCDKCEQQFWLAKDLREHLKFHMHKTFDTDICQEKYATCHGTEDDILLAHPYEKQFKQEICNKSFPLKTDVKRVYKRQEPHACPICSKVFRTFHGMEKHFQEHSGVEMPRFECKICGASLKNKRTLNRHMGIHEDEGKTFVCPKCPKILTNRFALANHQDSVHNLKVHKCYLCDKRFKRATSLAMHMANHTGEYSCIYCPTKFKSHENMYKHLKETHSDEWAAERSLISNKTIR